MPKLKDSTRERRRAQIVDAAVRRFARSGLSATSMADIVEEARLSAGSIYSHFDSKADLVRYAATALLEARLTAVRSKVSQLENALSPGQMLTLVAQDGLDTPSRSRLLLQILAETQHDAGLAAIASDNIHRLHALARTALAPWVSERSAEPGADVDELTEAVADALVAAVHGFVARMACDPDADPLGLLRRLAIVLDRSWSRPCTAPPPPTALSGDGCSSPV